MSNQMIEILAPAGSYESMRAAVAAGAAAVYMGGPRFGARAYADNPDEEGLLKAIDYVHIHGRRLYLTVNTLFKEQELDELYAYLNPCYMQGLDGVIVQDLGVLSYIKEHFPGLPLHASTQMTITGPHGAALLKQLGASRIVTARELSLEEIRTIREQTDVEIEAFVHGALCYCYSGQCMMSSLIGGRSGNRGRCAQPCRLPYQVRSGGKPAGRSDERYVMSLKDLCALDLIPQLAEAGVYSMKIEGRMKSPRYTAGVVSIYRKYADRYLGGGIRDYRVDTEDRRLLLDLFDRGGFTQGYYRRHNGRDMAVLKEKPAFRVSNQALMDYLDQTYVRASVREPVDGKCFFSPDRPSFLILEASAGSGQTVSVRAEGPKVQEARSQPVSKEMIDRQMRKTKDTPFVFRNLEIEAADNAFIPVQALNELRRDALRKLESEILDIYRRKAGEPGPVKLPGPGLTHAQGRRAGVPRLCASVEEECQLEAAAEHKDVWGVYIDAAGFGPQRWKTAAERCHRAGKTCMLALPRIFRLQGADYLERHMGRLRAAGFDGVQVRALEELGWPVIGELGLLVAADASVYAWNREAVKALSRLGVGRIALPWELNGRELEHVAEAARRTAAPVETELVIYGRIPMMITAQCVQKTIRGCSQSQEVWELKDRTGKCLPVKNRCAFCYNTIYNASPLSLLGCSNRALGTKPDLLRLDFTTETQGDVKDLLDAFADEFLRGAPVRDTVKDFTRGHFRRGVE